MKKIQLMVVAVLVALICSLTGCTSVRNPGSYAFHGSSTKVDGKTVQVRKVLDPKEIVVIDYSPSFVSVPQRLHIVDNRKEIDREIYELSIHSLKDR